MPQLIRRDNATPKLSKKHMAAAATVATALQRQELRSQAKERDSELEEQESQKRLAAAYGWDKPGEEGKTAVLESVKIASGSKWEAIRQTPFRLSIEPDEPPVTLDKLMADLPTSLDTIMQALASSFVQNTHPAFGFWHALPKGLIHEVRTKFPRKPEQGKPVIP